MEDAAPAPMKVHEAVAEALAAEGADTIFGLMGDANMSLWSVLLARGLARVQSARNEAGAVAMADGYHRATGRVGVATVTCGPGLTQTGTSLMAAARNRSALVVVTGDWPGHLPNTLQSMDQRRFVEACEARYVPAIGGAALAREVAGAFYLARRDYAPVVLSIRNDIQERAVEGAWRYTPSDAFLPPEAPGPSEEDVAWLIDALRAARRPLLLAGRGARISGARDAVLALGERTGALLGTTLQAKGMFADQPWSVGIVGGYASAVTEELCAEADLVLGVGAEIGHYTSWGGTLFPQATVVRIDPAPPPAAIPAAPARLIRADARRTLQRALEALGNRTRPGLRTDETRSRLEARPEMRPEADGGLDPRRLARRLGALLEPGVTLTCGVGHFQGFVAMYMPVPAGIPVEFSSQFGAVGQTLPLGIGAAMGRPDLRHLIIEGDGSLLMNIQELDTAAQAGVPITLAVWNDSGYGAEAQRLPGKGFPAAPATWTSPDFAAIARGFGGEGVTVRDADALAPALEAARRARGLFLIDLRVAQSERSDTYRKLYYGEPNLSPLLP